MWNIFGRGFDSRRLHQFSPLGRKLPRRSLRRRAPLKLYIVYCILYIVNFILQLLGIATLFLIIEKRKDVVSSFHQFSRRSLRRRAPLKLYIVYCILYIVNCTLQLLRIATLFLIIEKRENVVSSFHQQHQPTIAANARESPKFPLRLHSPINKPSNPFLHRHHRRSPFPSPIPQPRPMPPHNQT